MENILTSLCYVFVSCLILILGKNLYTKFLKYNMYEEILNKNVCAIIPYAGFLLGNTAILVGAFGGYDTQGFSKEILSFISYAVLGIVLMIFSGWLVEKTILHKFNNVDEIIRDKNIGTASVYFGMYLASGLIISSCVSGETLAQGRLYSFVSTIVYYVLGMLFLIIFAKIYDKLTPYSLLSEIENDNASVGIAFSGNIIAIGLILMRATIGEANTWEEGLISYLIDLSAILLLLPAVRIVLDKIIVKNINIVQEIKNNNISAGLAEGFVIVSFAILIFFMVDFVNIV